ncbi:flagellar filament capping protein FliD [Tissierella sp. Yu-01]|uniref:flagellar filament capping protein FliD n=1 Tax=Tissierella sp. Yu-01 TaxID=3035694 RepID=UPI00240D8E4C|nr:flagellar filament capping protein FliD [Tissierella sp. Yu-01]WFA07907.1 flagellar filament capping protein FliD [Tissierella sp. Yu-01]
MAGINFLGSYSGIDQSTIDQLMQIERLPLNQLAKQKTDITAKQNAWKDVNTRLNSLFDKLKALQNTDTFTSMTSKSSNEDIVTATSSKDAVAGTYKIEVIKLATNSRLVGSDKVADVYDDEGKFKALTLEGSFTIKNQDGKSTTIEVGKDDSLKTIVDNINDKTKDTGISATIIDSKIVLTDEKSGDRNIELSNNKGTVLDTLKLTGVEVAKGEQAEFTINGITAYSDSNTVSDKVLGLTINLKEVGNSTVTVATDTEKLTKTVQDFVDQYNSTMSFIEEQLAVGTVTKGANDSYTTEGRGTLAGDSSLRSLHSALRRMVTDSLGADEGITSIKDISQLGVSTTDKTGRLSFNSSKFLEQFSKDSQSVINFFGDVKGVDGAEDSVGFISKLNKQIDTYISSSDGLIKSKNESFDRTLKDLNRRIDDFSDRIARKEEYYKKKFAALDTAMMQAESQLEWLSGQISAMNAQTAANKK